MGVGSGRQEGRAPSPWIFKHGTDIVDRGLIVLFFGLFCYFSIFRCPPPLFFLPTPFCVGHENATHVQQLRCAKVVVVLPDPFPRMGARRNSVETQ